MKKIALIGILTGAVLFLLTCSNNFSILEEIETEVKIANDKFLVIESVSPDDKAANVNPGMEISIVFDRKLYLDSVKESTLRVYDDTVDSVTAFSVKKYITATNTLIIEPEQSYFENTHDYTVRVSGVEGEDGSELQEDYVWSFKTGTAPAGSILAEDRSGSALPGYTNERYVDVSVDSANPIAEDYCISTTESALDDPGSIDEGDWIEKDNTVTNFLLPNTEGKIPIYYIFRAEIDHVLYYSRTESYEITLDMTDPDVDAGDDRISNTSVTQTGSATEANIHSWSWSGSGLTFSPNNRYYTYISASSDGIYTATLTVMDKAGNTGSDTMEYERDTARPNPPVITAPSSPTTDTTPYFSWTGDESGDGGSFYVWYRTETNDSGSYDFYYTPGDTYALNSSPSISVSGADRVAVRLYARQRDAAGNLSINYDYDTVLVSNFLPYNTQTDVPVRPTLDWPTVKYATYDIQFYSPLLHTWFSIGTEAEGLTASSFSWHKSFDDLNNSATYIWRVVIHSGKVTTYGPSLSFTTED